MGVTDKDWYSNKDIYERLQDLKDMFLREVPELRSEMRNTKETIKKYNGLYAEIKDMKEDVSSIHLEIGDIRKTIDVKEECKSDVKKDKQWILTWIISLASILIAIFK